MKLRDWYVVCFVNCQDVELCEEQQHREDQFLMTLHRVEFNITRRRHMPVKKRENSDTVKELRNEDPLSGAAGAHPVGTGVGAALGGAATGAVAGAVAGPVGAAVGAAVGAVAGGLAGKGVAEGYDPTVETEYWRTEYRQRPYYSEDYSFEDYEPAYRAGFEPRANGSNTTWQDAEPEIHASWEKRNRQPELTWKQAKHAAQDAYNRVHTRTNKPR